MHLERVGERFVAAMAVLLAVAGNAAFAQEHKTYRCKVVDVVSWGDDGHLRLDGQMILQYDGLIVDTLTGAVTRPGGGRELWSVVRHGHDQGNDYVLTTEPRPDDPLKDAMYRAANQSIRIRTWGGKGIGVDWRVGPPGPVRFLVVEFGNFASGPCEAVR